MIASTRTADRVAAARRHRSSNRSVVCAGHPTADASAPRLPPDPDTLLLASYAALEPLIEPSTTRRVGFRRMRDRSAEWVLVCAVDDVVPDRLVTDIAAIIQCDWPLERLVARQPATLNPRTEAIVVDEAKRVIVLEPRNFCELGSTTL